MNDEHDMKAKSQQQSAVLEQQAGVQRAQGRDVAVEEHMSEQHDEVQRCAQFVGSDLDQHSDRMEDNLKEAGADDDVVKSAEQWRQSSQDAVADGADRANRFIAEVQSGNEKGKRADQNQENVFRAAELAQQYAVAVDERSLELASQVDHAIEERADEDQINGLFKEAGEDLEQLKEVFEDSIGRLEQSRQQSSPDDAAMHKVADEVQAKGKIKREEVVREEARKLMFERLKEEMESGIHSPALEQLLNDIGTQKVLDWLEEKITQKEAGVEASHILSLAEAPEYATDPQNIEPLSKDAHGIGVHGNDFNKERFGVPADTKYDKHVPFHEDVTDVDLTLAADIDELEKLISNEESREPVDLDDAIEIASADQPHDFEERHLEDLDNRREEERAEKERAKEQRYNQEREQLRVELERLEQQRAEQQLEQQRLEQQQTEQRREQQRLEQQRIEQQREQERLEQQRREQAEADLRRQEQKTNQ